MPEVDLLLTGYSMSTDQGGLGLSTVALIRGRQNILVDTGPHGRREVLLNALKAQGVSPDQIGTVVMTHAHWDHTQNVDVFPKAAVAIHPAELDYARSPKPSDWATARYFPESLRGRRVKEVVEGEEVEPGIKVLETPGHTKGSISLVVQTAKGPVAITGDAMSDAGTPQRGKPFLIFWDERQAEQSVQKLLKAARTFFPGHDRPFRLEDDNGVTYVGGDIGIRVSASLGHGLGTVEVYIGPGAPRQVRVMP
ncbi:MAG: MBL fold metallo-hydrolase [Chloroflexi bacterium]|nr:MBL fold metallo-hydrolase [Chloroflexota bacterium]